MIEDGRDDEGGFVLVSSPNFVLHDGSESGPAECPPLGNKMESKIDIEMKKNDFSDIGIPPLFYHVSIIAGKASWTPSRDGMASSDLMLGGRGSLEQALRMRPDPCLQKRLELWADSIHQ